MIRVLECIRGIQVCIPRTRESNIARYEYQASAGINERVHNSDSRSIL